MNKTFAVGAGLVLLVFAGWWLLSPGRSIIPSDNPQTVAVAFLDLVRAGHVDKAWEATGAEFKSFMGREQFRLFVKKHGEMKVSAAPGEVANEGALRHCSFMCGKLKLAVIVGVSDGRWRVEGVRPE